jgi:hypothetical protein
MVRNVRFDTEILALSLREIEQREPVAVTYPERLTCAAWTNSLLISLRNQVNFFDNNRGDGDVVAKDYLPGWKAKGTTKVSRDALRDRKNLISQRVAHLSLGRAGSREILHLADIEKHMDQLMRDFAEGLRGGEWEGCFHASLKDALHHIDTARPDGRAGR